MNNKEYLKREIINLKKSLIGVTDPIIIGNTQSIIYELENELSLQYYWDDME